MKASSLGENKVKGILRAFGRLSQYQFIWKWENETLFGLKPKNVLLQKWLPQRDVLCKICIISLSDMKLYENVFY